MPVSSDTDAVGETLLGLDPRSEPDLDVPAFLRRPAE
jgi:hypothetical protein